jgi:tetratricopeptide (TPR) repeat protein
MSEADYLMKLDAHCSLSQGFDKEMLALMENDMVLVPALMNLYVFDWVNEAGERKATRGKVIEAKKIDPEISNRIEEEYIKKSEKFIESSKYEDAKKLLARVIFLNPDNKSAIELFKKLKIMVFKKDFSGDDWEKVVEAIRLIREYQIAKQFREV